MQRTFEGDWQAEISAIAGAIQPGDTRESWLARAARKARISYRQCRSVFYGEAKDPRYSIASKILSAADRARIDAARRDGKQLADIYQNAARVLDPASHGSDVDALVAAARILGALDGAGTEGEMN